MRRSIRLLPLTMLVAFLLLGLKVGQVMRDGRAIALSLTQTAYAAEETKPAAKPAEKSAEGAKKEGDPKVNPPAAGQPNDSEEEEAPQRHEYTQVEVDLLQSLAKRRQDLDDWAKQIQIKENMLIATEQRINEKIGNLQKMKQEIEALLAQYNQQEDTKIRSLVKIYENMKPAQAARIFEELDMPVLLTVVDRMSERKVSPILAGMTPQKAKDLTIQLAEQRKLKKPGAGAAPPPAPTSGSANPTNGADAGQPAAPAAASGSAPAADAGSTGTTPATGAGATPAAGANAR